jgi:hypothetical protein
VSRFETLKRFPSSADKLLMETPLRSINTRRYPRRIFTESVGCLYRGQYQIVQARQLGQKGMMFENAQDIAAGDYVVVSFVISRKHYLILRAEARYVKEDQEGTVLVGFEFTDIKAKDKRTIREYISAKTEAEAQTEKQARSI